MPVGLHSISTYTFRTSIQTDFVECVQKLALDPSAACGLLCLVTGGIQRRREDAAKFRVLSCQL